MAIKAPKMLRLSKSAASTTALHSESRIQSRFPRNGEINENILKVSSGSGRNVSVLNKHASEVLKT